MNPWSKLQRDYWNTISFGYDTLYSTPWSKLENNQLLTQLKSLSRIKPGSQILDLGCGTGLGFELCNILVGSSFSYSGLDISPEMIEICTKKWNDATFLVGDMSDLSNFPSNHFDVVLCLFTAFSFTDKPESTLSEIYRILKDEGEVFISVLSKHSLRRLLRGKTGDIELYSTRYSPSIDHVPAHVYTGTTIKQMFEMSGFTIRNIYGQGFFSGLIEYPLIWPIDSLLSSVAVSLCHLINISGVRKE